MVAGELGGKITRPPGPIPIINTKIVAFVDPDGWETVRLTRNNILSSNSYFKERELINISKLETLW